MRFPRSSSYLLLATLILLLIPGGYAESNTDLQLSASPDRSSAVALDSESVSEDIYVFATPDTDVSQVSFYLDDPGMSGAPFSIDDSVPFDFAGTDVAVFVEANGLVSIEAEHYVANTAQGGHNWVEVLPSGYSGSGAMTASPNIQTNNDSGYLTSSPRLDYQAYFAQAGTYYVWIRGMGATDKDDSVQVGIDNAAVDTSDKITGFGSTWTWSQQTMDSPVATVTIPSAGMHTVNVWMREDGFVIDKLVLTTTTDCPECLGTMPVETPGAVAYDSTLLTDGAHEITAVVGLADGGTEVVTASFDVVNVVSRLAFVPSQLSFSVVDGGTPSSQTVNLVTSNAPDTAYSISNNTSWLTISPLSGTTPAVLDVSVDTSGLPSGTYNDVITASAAGFAIGTVDVQLVVGSATQSHDLQLSISPDRTSAVSLDSESVSGGMYVFVTPDTDVSQVSFYLDDPGMSGAPFSTDGSAPFDFAGTDVGVFIEANGLVSIEAEHYIANTAQGGHNWVEVLPGGYSGSGAMMASPNNGTNINTGYVTSSPRLDYRVYFSQAGTYYVWVRGMGATDKDDSVHVGIDNAAVDTSDKITGFGSTWTWSQQTMDSPAATVTIPSAGMHTVNVWMREDGVVIDKLVLTTTTDCPECLGTMPVETPEAVAYDSTLLTDGAHEITAVVGLADGGTEVVTASFDVVNVVSRLTFDTNQLSFSVVDGGTPSSQTVNLVTSNAPDTAYSISNNTSWLTISPLSGTTPAVLDVSVDTSGLPSGTYNDVITASAAGFAIGTVDVQLVVGSATQSHDLQLSISPDRTSAVSLDSESVSGGMYVFVTPDTDVSQVSFYLDDPGMSGAPFSTDGSAPFDFAGTDVGVFIEANGLVSIEAEHYIANTAQGGHNWVEVLPGGYSGSGAMMASPNNGTNINTGYVTSSPRLDYRVYFSQAGTYYVWVRGMGATDKDDSVHVGIDNAAVDTSDKITGFGSTWTWSQQTMDSPAATVTIPSAGMHTVNVWMREDGVVIDKLVLTTTTDCPECLGTMPVETPEAVAYDSTLLTDGAHEITAVVGLADGGTEVVTASFTVDNTFELPFSDGFDDINTDFWSEDNDSGNAMNWQVVDGQYFQIKLFGGSTFEESYHTGLISFLNIGMLLDNYQFDVDMTPLSTTGNDIGVLFRYQNNDNYYRFSMNARYGYTRLEKKVDGQFSTLATNARGYIKDDVYHLSIVVLDSYIQVSLNGDSLFGVYDSSLAFGSIGLYTQDVAIFDNVNLVPPPLTPTIVISSPLSHSVTTSGNLLLSAIAFNLPANYQVRYFLDGLECEAATENPPGVFQSECFNVLQGDYSVTSILYDAGSEVAMDTNINVSALGDYMVSVGDSITNGFNDNFAADNTSINETIISIQGYQSNLVDLISTKLNVPVILFNEGIPGDTTDEALYDRIDSILQRHPEANQFLVLLGTNDAAALYPSGLGCSGASCNNTYKGNMQLIVNKIVAAGVTPIVAFVPPNFSSSAPLGSAVNMFINEYNAVIASELTNVVVGPDFFTFFLNNNENLSNLFYDAVHPNALGFVVMAQLWFNKLSTTPLPIPLILKDLSPFGYKQNLLDVGDAYYIDEPDYGLADIPVELEKGVWIMTANSDRMNNSQNYIRFSVDRSVTVYVAYDSNATGLPDWLSGFTDTGLTLSTSNPGSPLHRIYKAEYGPGNVTLGGNMATGSSGSQSNFIVAVTDNLEPRLAFVPSQLSFSVVDGGTPSSQTVNLVTSNAPDTAYSISNNTSWLTISPLSGTTPAVLDVSVDTSGLPSGTYNDVITASAAGFAIGTVDVQLVVGSATQSHDLQLSISPDRTSAVSLDSESVSGGMYVFVTPDTDVSQVSFYLDDPGMSGAPFSTDGSAPFDFAGTDVGVFIEANGLVSIEAEHYIANTAQGGHNWVEVLPGGYSGSGAMMASPNNGTNINTGYVTSSPRLDYRVYFSQAGTYYVWVRGMGATDKDDSVHVGIDNAAVDTSDKITGFGSTWTWSQQTMDSPAATVTIPSAGMHTVNVWMREDGVVIDKLVLTTTTDCPECLGTMPVETPEAVAYDSTLLTDGAHEITAVVGLAGGGTEVVTASFDVVN